MSRYLSTIGSRNSRQHQWSAVGTYTNVPPFGTAVIDPEALICATMWFGRYSPRLFDEAMDWLCINDALISLDRHKSIARVFSALQEMLTDRLANSSLRGNQSGCSFAANGLHNVRTIIGIIDGKDGATRLP